jgi:hypothetical protein
MTDTERLDWLESQGYAIRSRYWGPRNLIVWHPNLPGCSIRHAIDCAQKRHIRYIKGGKPLWLIKGQPF